jgi:hypothetical protein
MPALTLVDNQMLQSTVEVSLLSKLDITVGYHVLVRPTSLSYQYLLSLLTLLGISPSNASRWSDVSLLYSSYSYS